jgi:hypothetical protein
MSVTSIEIYAVHLVDTEKPGRDPKRSLEVRYGFSKN